MKVFVCSVVGRQVGTVGFTSKNVAVATLFYIKSLYI